MQARQPVINTPIEQFLKPTFDTWARCGIKMSVNRIENGVLYLNVNKRACGG